MAWKCGRPDGVASHSVSARKNERVTQREWQQSTLATHRFGVSAGKDEKHARLVTSELVRVKPERPVMERGGGFKVSCVF